MKGQLTVEAAYVFPFCFVVIGLVCYLGLFLYNQSVLKMTGYECILQAVAECEREEDMQVHLLRIAKESAQMRTLAVRDLQTNVETTVFKISISYQGVQNGLNIPVSVTIVYEKTFPERLLRLTKGRTGE